MECEHFSKTDEHNLETNSFVIINKNINLEAMIMESQMQEILNGCRGDDWSLVLRMVQDDPTLATKIMKMDNRISTTILHQAISSKGDVRARTEVIQAVLKTSPEVAMVSSGYGSLPLHAICQRNTKMPSQMKEKLIKTLIDAYPKALLTEGGIARRTPLHVAFTDYLSPQLANTMIEMGPKATFMKDKKGWLPIHVAVSRHCSPEKLRMLLKANPASLKATTGPGGDTLLDLARNTRKKGHPNKKLIAEIERQLGEQGPNQTVEDIETIGATVPAQAKASPRVSPKRKRQDAALVTPTPSFRRKRQKCQPPEGEDDGPSVKSVSDDEQLAGHIREKSLITSAKGFVAKYLFSGWS